MAELTLAKLCFFLAVITLAYAVRGSAGFGGVTIPLLALFMSIKAIVPMVTVLGIISSFIVLRQNFRHAQWRDIARLMPFCAIGVLIGLYFFDALDTRALARALGLMVVAYGAFSMWRTFRSAFDVHLPPRIIVPVAGTAAGIVGTLFGALAGPFFAMYFDLRRFGKDEFRATIAGTLFALGVLRGIGFVAVGAYTNDTLMICLAALPPMALGVFLGNRIHANLNDVMFKRFVALVLILSGIPLTLR